MTARHDEADYELVDPELVKSPPREYEVLQLWVWQRRGTGQFPEWQDYGTVIRRDAVAKCAEFHKAGIPMAVTPLGEHPWPKQSGPSAKTAAW